MRVAWLVPGGFSPNDPDDHNPVLFDLSQRIGASVEIVVYSFSGSDRETNDRSGAVEIRRLAAHVRDNAWKRLTSLRRSFIRDHRRRPYDLLHAFWALPSGVHAVLLGASTRVPHLVSFPGGDTAAVKALGYGNLVRLRSRIGTRFVCRRASRIHCLTDFQREQLQGAGMMPSAVSVVPIGVDTAVFSAKARIPDPPYRLLHVSNLTEIKDQVTLLRAFRQIREKVPSRLRIVGPDHMDGRLQQAARDLGIADAVEFQGRVSRNDLPDHYAWAHLYLHSSLHEGQSVSVVEAMACGVPVCGTRVGIIADLPASCVIAVDRKDAGALAHATLRLLSDPAAYREQADAARLWSQSNSIDITCAKVLDLYASLVSRRAP